jgi:hypothetical protein
MNTLFSFIHFYISFRRMILEIKIVGGEMKERNLQVKRFLYQSGWSKATPRLINRKVWNHPLNKIRYFYGSQR